MLDVGTVGPDVLCTGEDGVKGSGRDDHQANIIMTLTAPGCGMGPTIVGDVKQRVIALPKITEVSVEMVFDPPWDREMMSDVAKLELGLF